MLNKVFLIGRAGRDPETRYTGDGKAVSSFSLATDDYRKDGEASTTWHNIVAWERQSEVVQKFVQKGTLCFIEGRLSARQWTDREGAKRTAIEIVAYNIQALSGRKQAEGQPPAARPVSDDSDIPF